MEYRENRDVRRPFLATPDSRVYFPASAIERARRTTERCLRRGEGIALVVGATGVGKTMLSRVLAASFEEEDLVVVASPLRKNDVKSFLQQILFGLRQTFCGCDETELRLMTLDYLERSQRRRFVLIVDDAQNLSFRVFDEIRVLVDQGPALAAQISVAFVGSNLLEERLNLPRFYPIQQRVAVRSYLDVFERSETNDYLDREMERFGASARFSPDAKNLIAELSEGSPRIVNQLSDRALVLAFPDFIDAENVEGEIDRVFVERAWANLQNLPEEDGKKIERSAVDSNASASNVVEFGTLEDDDEDEKNDDRAKKNDNFERVAGRVDNNDGRDGNGDSADGVRAGVDVKKIERKEVGEPNDERIDEIAAETPGKSNVGESNVAKIDWEDERYGNGGDRRADDGENGGVASDETSVESDSESDGASTEIDAELEARLLAKWGGAGADVSPNRDDDVPTETLENASFAKNDENVENVEGVEKNKNVDNVKNIEKNGGEERNLERKVFDALKSNDFDRDRTNAAENASQDESTSAPRAVAADFAALFSKSKTRRPATETDDGSDEFEKVNGFSVDDAARLALDERFWEANLSPDSISEKTVYSNGSGRNDVAEPLFVANSDGEYLALEDRAYRQIVDVCNRTVSESSGGDEYLTELNLLEQEIEEEANLVRKIRKIHLRLRAARGEKTLDEKEKNDASSNSPLIPARPNK